MEEELRRVLQQEQDEAKAAQAAETRASLTVPERCPSPGGPTSARGPALRLPESLPTPSRPFTCPVWARCPRPLPPPRTWLTTAPITLARGGAKHRKGVHGEQLSCAQVEIRGDWREGVPLPDLSSRSSRLRGT